MPVGTSNCKDNNKVNGEEEYSNSDGDSSSCEGLGHLFMGVH